MSRILKFKLILGSVLVTALAVAPAADARRVHLSGDFDGDTNSAISMEVVVRHGEPKRVRDIQVTDLDYRCDGTGDSGEKSARLGGARIVPSSSKGFFTFRVRRTRDGARYSIYGVMRESLDNIRGSVLSHFDATTGTCVSSAIYKVR